MEQQRQQREQYYQTLDDNTIRWYVMQNGNPRLLDFQLKRENALRRQSEGRQAPQVEYFIPFCFLTHTPEKGNEKQADEVENANGLRQDLHDFVFIHTTRRGIAMLVDQEWNRSMRSRLYHYRDIHGELIVLNDSEMQKLITVFSERRIKFSIGLPVTDLGPDVEVQIIKEGTFKGQTARIIEVRPTTDGIFLKLGITMFQGMKELKLTDLTLDDIQQKGEAAEIISQRFIRDAEASLLDIISRRLHHKETDATRQADAVTLNHLFLFSYITIADPATRAHFLALMLICATLRFDRPSTLVLSAQATTTLATTTLPPDLRANLNLSLYIATRDADYRTAAKQLLQQPSQHSSRQQPQQSPADTPTPLRRLLTLTTKMHSRRSRK